MSALSGWILMLTAGAALEARHRGRFVLCGSCCSWCAARLCVNAARAYGIKTAWPHGAAS